MELGSLMPFKVTNPLTGDHSGKASSKGSITSQKCWRGVKPLCYGPLRATYSLNCSSGETECPKHRLPGCISQLCQGPPGEA